MMPEPTPAEELRQAAARLRDGSNSIDVLLSARKPLVAWLDSAATAYDDLNRAADQVLAGKENYAEAEQALRRGPYDMQEALAVASAINGTQP